MGAAVLEAVAQVKRAHPKALYCCDPVIGDTERGAYVAPDIAEFIRRQAVPVVDIVTPNHFELERLTGCAAPSLDAALAAVEALRKLGPRVVLVTSLATVETPRDSIELLACDADGRHRLRTPRLPIAVHGAGDAIAALFLVHYLRTSSAAEALSRAASSVFGIVKQTSDAGAQELSLIEAQQELVKPTTMFKSEPL
jgi:pyridoxine kinase